MTMVLQYYKQTDGQTNNISVAIQRFALRGTAVKINQITFGVV